MSYFLRMLQRTLVFVFCVFILVSCEFFQMKKLSNEDILDTIVDYNSVDVFPLFPTCETIAAQEKQRICSQIKLSEHIYASLTSFQITTSKKLNDTIYVKLLIDKIGVVSLVEISATELLKSQIPTLDSLIQKGVLNLPKLKPAIKRGILVSTEFTLPIVIMN